MYSPPYPGVSNTRMDRKRSRVVVTKKGGKVSGRNSAKKHVPKGLLQLMGVQGRPKIPFVRDLGDLLGFRFQQEHKLGPTQMGSVLHAPVSIGNIVRESGLRTRSIRRSEMIRTLNGSIALNVIGIDLNAGYAQAFPRLAVEAANYQFYHFRSLKFRFETVSPTSAKGQFVMVPEYNPRDPLPSSEQEVCNAQGAVGNPCWTNGSLSFNVASMSGGTTQKFVRAGINGIETSLCDCGKLILATVGMADDAAIGRLWVDYDCDLSTNQVAQQHVRTARIQSLGLTADVLTLDNPNEQVLPLTSLTQKIWTDPLATGEMYMPPGVFRIHGTIGLVNSSAVNTMRTRLFFKFDSIAPGATTGPLLNYEQYASMIPAAIAGVSNDSTLPFSFIARFDSPSHFFALTHGHVGTAGDRLTLRRGGTIIHIEPI